MNIKHSDMTDVVITGAAGQPLTAPQKQKLAVLARRAHVRQCELGLWAEGDVDGFRRAACFDLCGRAGLRQLIQRDYGPACRMFLELAGVDVSRARGAAAYSATKCRADDDADRARWKLQQECEAQGGAFGGIAGAQRYVAALLHKIHHTTLEQATARQLWQVYFTLRNRARAKRA